MKIICLQRFLFHLFGTALANIKFSESRDLQRTRVSDSLNPTLLNNHQIFQSKDFQSVKLAEISDDEHFGGPGLYLLFLSGLSLYRAFRGDDHIKSREQGGDVNRAQLLTNIKISS